MQIPNLIPQPSFVRCLTWPYHSVNVERLHLEYQYPDRAGTTEQQASQFNTARQPRERPGVDLGPWIFIAARRVPPLFRWPLAPLEITAIFAFTHSL
jgi:hypothetical protein